MIRAKDVVVLASLINIAVVALVLSTSVQKHSDAKTTSMRFEEPVNTVVQSETHSVKEARVMPADEPLCLDEIDALLQEYEKGAIADADQVNSVQANTVQANSISPAQVQPKAQPASQKFTLHIIQKGDSPWKIAKKYGMSFEELLKINGLDSKSAKNLKIGQTVKVIPKK